MLHFDSVYEIIHFNSRPPNGGRPSETVLDQSRIHISTHDLQTEVDDLLVKLQTYIGISTHDLQTEVDLCSPTHSYCSESISTHDLQTEVDGNAGSP